MGSSVVRAVRGAITVEENSQEAISEATQLLLREILQKNCLDSGKIISAFFTLTTDLNAVFPAAAAREMPGWDLIPMLCAHEIEMPGQLALCIRVMLHIYSSRGREDIRHVYLRRAGALRPDLK